MNKVNIDLANCYGIKKLTDCFDFGHIDSNNNESLYSIYAPNGFMKTSLSKVFNDVQKAKDTSDLIFPDRETIRTINDENGDPLKPETIFVIEPYIEGYTSENTSNLLVNPTLKAEYDHTLKKIDTELSSILKTLKQLSGLNGRTVTPTTEILSCFNKPDDGIHEFINQIAKDVSTDTEFENINYSEVFNDQTIKLLESGDIKQQIQDYIERYTDLVNKSPVLNKKFNHSGASDLTKNLSKNGFFEAQHTINVFDGNQKNEVVSAKEFEEIVNNEKEKILSDTELLKNFDAVDKKLSNTDLKNFRSYLFNNKEILPELENFKEFKKKLWMSYLNSVKDEIISYSETYELAKNTIEKIVLEAREEQTIWDEVVSVFNTRFFVPFSLSIENQKDVILKDMTPKISFNFKEGGDIKKVTPQSLLSVLSQGEKRALYILNLLFEVKFRIKNNLPTLFIVDDIADSFDYKNKYSIIEYFRELSLIEHFSFIFLTHNFDFHRTISSRLSISRKKRLFTLKNDSGLSFGKEKYQNNPFSTWKNLCHKNTSCLIACIPLVRNLVEYSEGIKSQNYLKLTSLLHYKGDSEDITILDLQGIYRDVIKERHDLVLANPEEKLLDVVFIEADDISSKNEESIEIEYKIVLSISIRLKAEIFMINKINDTEFATSLKKNQTIRLYERYQNDFPGDYGNLSILSQVNLMTPENIHLNAFMYEPILDMSALHLYELYHNIKALS